MVTFPSLEEAAKSEGWVSCAACLGSFDGVHVGHQALFQKAKTFGAVVAVTFDPHPGKVLQPALAPRLIATPRRKLELLAAAQVSACVVQPFTKAYASTSPEAFEAMIFDGLRAKAVVVGYDFTYGKARAGTVTTLSSAAQRRGAHVEVVSAVTIDGVVVSSSKIREYVLEGRVDAAARLLGRPFDLDGVVVRGDARGRTIGFPTANVATDNELRPGSGVYVIEATLPDGRKRAGVANIGVKPTFGGTDVTIECHLFDFDEDLYGHQLRVAFLARLRSEQRFSGVDTLKAQIAHDVREARAFLNRR